MKPNLRNDIEKLQSDTVANTASWASNVSHQNINPDNYTGNDLQKMQQAINDAVSLSKNINLSRLYNVTGLGILYVDCMARTKTLTFTQTNGGGFIKNDTGILFSANIASQDCFFDNITFQSIEGAGTRLFLSPNVRRLTLQNCFFLNVDTIIYTQDTGYMQSVRMLGGTITRGKGACIDAVCGYDCTFENMLIENRDSFFTHRKFGALNWANVMINVRIKDCNFQSIIVNPIILGYCFGVSIDHNYFESNNSAISFWLTDCAIYGLSIKNNTEIVSSVASAFIKWSGWVDNAICENNMSNISNHPIHDTTLMTGSFISINDGRRDTNVPNIDPQKLIQYLGKLSLVITPTLLNGYTIHSQYMAQPKFTKNGNIVTLEGDILVGTINNQVMVLPIGYRNIETSRYKVTSETGVADITIDSLGGVVCSTCQGTWFCLNGISFITN